MSFLILKPSFDLSSRTAIFPFQLGKYHFTEALVFPQNFDQKIAQTEQFQTLLNLTACTLGTSYFKLMAPFEINIPEFSLTNLQQELLLDLYENGLGEFYARNGLSRFGKLQIEVQTAPLPNRKNLNPTANSRALLLIGGGKDSNVSAQLLEAQHISFTPFAVNPKGPILTSVKVMNHPPLFIKRTIDKKLFALSNQPEFYNGHVPSTAINSMIAALCATLFGYDHIILSNERSASEATSIHDGREVNHQHSKSFAFEQLLRKTLAQTSAGALDYFSLLRPLSELKIGKIFAQTTKYDAHFSSCNTNFKQGENTKIKWCNACPKCHFVYLMLAPFMPIERLDGIFSDIPLSNMDNYNSFAALVGLTDQKPWECVGETIEAAAALYRLSAQSSFKNVPLVQKLTAELLKTHTETTLISAFKKLMQDSDQHCLAPQYLAATHNATKLKANL